MALNSRSENWRTVIVTVRLRGADYQRAHDAAHALAGVWNLAVQWVRGQWAAGNHAVEAYACKRYLSTLATENRPLHAHTTQAVAFDLFDAIKTSRANRKLGLKTRGPWREKNYRPLSFTRGFGWRVTPNSKQLSLSLGRGRRPIRLSLPTVVDAATEREVPPVEWGEIRLCWDRDAREWSLHIAIPTEAPAALDPDRVVAIDEGIINPMTLAAIAPDSTDKQPTIDVLVINGREARAVKRQRNKTVGKIARKQSHCTKRSHRHRQLDRARKRANARAKATLRDFNHQVSRKAAQFAVEHDAGRIVAGDVRGIEQNTERKRRAHRHTRQQLSQWERGTHEQLLEHKTGVEIDHVDESYSSQTCPACHTRNRPNGRRYRCRECKFTCHRDAVGAINILMRAIHRNYARIDPATIIRVTYLRAVPRWSSDQQEARRKAQARKARARSRAKNQATNNPPVVGVTGNGPGATATIAPATAPLREAA